MVKQAHKSMIWLWFGCLSMVWCYRLIPPVEGSGGDIDIGGMVCNLSVLKMIFNLDQMTQSITYSISYSINESVIEPTNQ